MKSTSFIIATVFAITHFAFAINIDEYSNRTISDVLENSSSLTDYDSGISIVLAKYKCIAIYHGNTRIISENKMNTFKTFLFFSFGNASFADNYEYEAEFEESGYAVWLPIQNDILPYFEDEVRPGDSIILYYMFIGYSIESDTWLFVNTDFQTI